MTQENRPIRVLVTRGVVGPETEPTLVPKDPSRHLTHTPPIDIHEEAEGLVLEADLPGVCEKSIAIELADNVLTLHARVESTVPEGARLLHQEFHSGDFARSFILSDEIESGQIAAEIKHGVLRLSLPKAARLKTRKIEVKGGS